MANKILTSQQKNFLHFISNVPTLSKAFYFTGGTCLSAYYLQHRYSEDLDFFSEEEIDNLSITALLKRGKDELKFTLIDYQQSFNRNLYFLTFDDASQLKIEFTYFPFLRIDRTQMREGIHIDSMMDISVNKIFTIYQKPRGRDFYDLYAIYQDEQWDLHHLMKLARTKFDVYIDPLQLGRNIMQVEELKDDPLVINQTYKYANVISFFRQQVSLLKKNVIETTDV